MIASLTKRLFAEKPQHTLYHYTSLNGAMGIVESGSLRATEIRYFSDAAEMTYTANLLRAGIRSYRSKFSPMEGTQLENWLDERLIRGPMLFVACFTENGNLLSQWRSYSPTAKGASLGFDAAKLDASATRQSYVIGKCVYDAKVHIRIVTSILKNIWKRLRGTREERKDNPWLGKDTRLYPIFDEVETDLLRVAALLKHPSFHEEKEWRVVSSVMASSVTAPIKYREGSSMLVPFRDFHLPVASNEGIDIEHVILGPTPNMSISMKSLSAYLSQKKSIPRKGVIYCRIPYRTW